MMMVSWSYSFSGPELMDAKPSSSEGGNLNLLLGSYLRSWTPASLNKAAEASSLHDPGQ